MSDEGLEEDVLALIKSSDLQDSVADLSEAGLDQLLQAGFMRDVPVLGGIIGAIRTAGSIRDLLLAKKLARFIRGLQSVPIADRQAFDRSLAAPEERRRIGEALLLLLDRLDEMSTPELVARLFREYMRGEIGFVMFQRMATAVDRLNLGDFEVLIRFYSAESPNGAFEAMER